MSAGSTWSSVVDGRPVWPSRVGRRHCSSVCCGCSSKSIHCSKVRDTIPFDTPRPRTFARRSIRTRQDRHPATSGPFRSSCHRGSSYDYLGLSYDYLGQLIMGPTDSQSGAALLFWSPVSLVVELRVSSRAPGNPPGTPFCVDGLKQAEGIFRRVRIKLSKPTPG